MPTFGITGHMDLNDATQEGVREELHRSLTAARGANLVGVSCLADGADSIFAEVVLELGGRLDVILPSHDYRDEKVAPDDRPRFDGLLARATDVTIMAERADRHAYEAANARLLASCDVLVAVWDGIASDKPGGTAATVRQAQSLGKPVIRVWREWFTRRSSA